MTTLRDAAQQALEALIAATPVKAKDPQMQADAIVALRAALAEPAEQEPVAWKHDCAALLTNDVELWIDACPHCGKPRPAPQPKPAEQEPMGVPQGWKLVPDVPTNEWINNLAKTQTGSLEDVPFPEIHQCIAELLDAAPEKHPGPPSGSR